VLNSPLQTNNQKATSVRTKSAKSGDTIPGGKAGKSLVLRQLGEKVRFSGKEAAFYLEAKPECGFIWKLYKQ
jgi:hypothetical protein